MFTRRYGSSFNKILLSLTSAAAISASATSIGAAAESQTTPVAVKEACSVQHRDAALSGTPLYFMPLISQAEGVDGTSVVKVTLSPNGDLLDAAIWNSSGDSNLDKTALHVARLSKYEPETENCAGVSGSYLIDVQFGAV